ncbi:GNAT family N-acetyltransferase [Paenibacillus apiarius]|uniref:GNAT family N-acetyltransferase n=1 Tax=Paenibacillus apiarius TaxID=46240 RepID=A0ABT4DMY3_9BACL|nr:GNAT family N-acetyltransferase [Paenibacillus apiarius]MCY9514610.1 GNAT family N-acetyltransferase [Paenibacillus apiarius]MCY9518600.1 GNAT family N-acetyltransferase [Paenibacillus apiarius]MCY9552688.1 GNAT family N-acetyltransferase [Paenibacillus apiarius]MCY9556984.1 GNAT family N-acetyltransferase [Paenibacillus apiarius]MCY9686063.1 GNAT family N-acetyltransferase [Paenibacillus apiarius]
MNGVIAVVPFQEKMQIQQLHAAFAGRGITRPEGYFEKCFRENQNGTRFTFIGYVDGQVAGCAHLKTQSDYPPFQERGIPEINDLNVFPEFQRRGIASRLFDEFETIAASRAGRIGVGVGLYQDYGKAQIMYGKRGYALDGNGVYYDNIRVEPGEMVRMNDDLVLYLVKELNKE